MHSPNTEETVRKLDTRRFKFRSYNLFGRKTRVWAVRERESEFQSRKRSQSLAFVLLDLEYSRIRRGAASIRRWSADM